VSEIHPKNETWRGNMHMDRLITSNNSTTLCSGRTCLILAGPMGYEFEILKECIFEIRQAVGKIWEWSWVIKNGIVICHNAPEVPKKLVFRAKNVSAIYMLNKLRELKYNVL